MTLKQDRKWRVLKILSCFWDENDNTRREAENWNVWEIECWSWFWGGFVSALFVLGHFKWVLDGEWGRSSIKSTPYNSISITFCMNYHKGILCSFSKKNCLRFWALITLKTHITNISSITVDIMENQNFIIFWELLRLKTNQSSLDKENSLSKSIKITRS